MDHVLLQIPFQIIDCGSLTDFLHEYIVMMFNILASHKYIHDDHGHCSMSWNDGLEVCTLTSELFSLGWNLGVSSKLSSWCLAGMVIHKCVCHPLF